jgi:acetyltransferase-like isoleucine patch superfamily enzyme
MRLAGRSVFGRLATWLATWFAPPYTARWYLAKLSPHGYIDPQAILHHAELTLGAHVFIADRVVLNQAPGGGEMVLGDRVAIFRDTIVATGEGGTVTIGENTVIQPRCNIMGYKGSIQIGRDVQIAPNCGLYSYDHSYAEGLPIGQQPLRTRGGVVVEDDVWLGFGVVVLDGVRIGKGAVIGAGSIVTRDIPPGAVAVGNPARVVRMRIDLARTAASVKGGDGGQYGPS